MIYDACWHVAIFIPLARRPNSQTAPARYNLESTRLHYCNGARRVPVTNMQTYDMMMLVVLIGATIFGFWKGMAWQIASLASLIVSYFAALRFSEQLAPMFGQQAPLNRFVAMAAIYVGTSFFIWTLFRFISKAIDKVRLESFDKQLGAMIGFAKGVLLCIAITFFAVVFSPKPQGEAIVNSQSGRYIVALLDKAHTVFPPEIHQIIDPYLNKVEERLNPNFQPHGQDLQQAWQNQGKANTPGWPQLPQLPQINWPQSQPSQSQQWPTPSPLSSPPPGWPTSSQVQPSQSQPAWPAPQTQPQTADRSDPYSTPREPQLFPGPYAERPASRDY
jgi:membrane protein required for colicin V production